MLQILTDNMAQFGAVEIQNARHGYWVLVRRIKGGAELVAQFSDHQEARDYATELGDECDWPVRDHSDQGAPQPALTIFGVAQWSIPDTSAFKRFGFIAAETWQQAQVAASLHWPARDATQYSPVSYDLAALIANIHKWGIPPSQLDTTLPTTASPIPAGWCPHCASQTCASQVADVECFLKGKS